MIPLTYRKTTFPKISFKHSERCPKCKETIKVLLKRIYGAVETNYKLYISADPEDFKQTPCYENLKRIFVNRAREVDLEGVWIDYVDFGEISKNKTKFIFRTTFIPSKPMTGYGKIFLAMFTQTEFHPTMKEEIQNQLKKFKELVEG